MFKKCIAMILAVTLVATSSVFVFGASRQVMGDYVAIAAGHSHSLVVKSGGSLYAWGSNIAGQLGDGTTRSWYWDEEGNYVHNNTLTPIKIMDDAVWVAAGNFSSMAVKTDGSLWAWGNIFSDGKAVNVNYPVKIMNEVATVASGGDYSFAIKMDGALWAWGSNLHGQLGDGTLTDRSIPVKIMENVETVAAGDTHSLAVKNDGSLWAWGSNLHGQLGDGTLTDRSTPVKIMENVATIAAGETHSLAVKNDGSLWAWGSNWHGALGDGTSIDRHMPVKVMDDVVSVSASRQVSFAVKSDKSLWAWGDNPYGKLGDGTTMPKNTPVKIMDNVVAVSAGTAHSLAVKTDGSLWAWGSNWHGQLGDGTRENRHTPVQITGFPQRAISVTLNGQALTFNQPPIVENERTLVPLRVIFEALGASIEWNQSIRTVTAVKNGTTITMQIDNPIMIKDGANITLDVPPRLINSHTLVPVRAVAESFNASVEWDSVNRVVIIIKK